MHWYCRVVETGDFFLLLFSDSRKFKEYFCMWLPYLVGFYYILFFKPFSFSDSIFLYIVLITLWADNIRLCSYPPCSLGVWWESFGCGANSWHSCLFAGVSSPSFLMYAICMTPYDVTEGKEIDPTCHSSCLLPRFLPSSENRGLNRQISFEPVPSFGSCAIYFVKVVTI